MMYLKLVTRTLLIAFFTCALSVSAHAAVIAINFDNTFDGLLSPPFVGSGTLSFDGPATDGVFIVENLPNFSFHFDFAGDIFTNADLVDFSSDVFVVISGSATQVNFDTTGELTRAGGSLEFQNPANATERILVFEPGGGGGTPPLPDNYETNSFFGNYTVATIVPLPAAVWLFGSGLLGLIGFARARKR